MQDVLLAVDAEVQEEGMTKVVIDISQKEEARAYESAKSIGLMVEFNRLADVADVCDTTLVGIDKMPPMTVANKVSRASFIAAYALARADSTEEVKKLKVANKRLLDDIEVRANKQSKAEKLIWELKTLVQVFLSIRGRRFELTVDNLDKILSTFPKLQKKSREDVIDTFKGVVGSKGTLALLKQLCVRYDRLEKRKKDKTTIARNGRK